MSCLAYDDGNLRHRRTAQLAKNDVITRSERRVIAFNADYGRPESDKAGFMLIYVVDRIDHVLNLLTLHYEHRD